MLFIACIIRGRAFLTNLLGERHGPSACGMMDCLGAASSSDAVHCSSFTLGRRGNVVFKRCMQYQINFVLGCETQRRRVVTGTWCRSPAWRCEAVIVKTGDDCRQELLAMQLISIFVDIFATEKLPLWMRPYEVLPTSHQTALVELMPNAVSIHSIKRCLPPDAKLSDHFFKLFPPGTEAGHLAQDAFAESLAAYSLVCYLLQIKDRHNANILLDLEVRCSLGLARAWPLYNSCCAAGPSLCLSSTT